MVPVVADCVGLVLALRDQQQRYSSFALPLIPIVAVINNEPYCHPKYEKLHTLLSKLSEVNSTSARPISCLQLVKSEGGSFESSLLRLAS